MESTLSGIMKTLAFMGSWVVWQELWSYVWDLFAIHPGSWKSPCVHPSIFSVGSTKAPIKPSLNQLHWGRCLGIFCGCHNIGGSINIWTFLY